MIGSDAKQDNNTSKRRTWCTWRAGIFTWNKREQWWLRWLGRSIAAVDPNSPKLHFTCDEMSW